MICKWFDLLVKVINSVTGKEYTDINVISVFDCCDLFSMLIRTKIYKSIYVKRGVDREYRYKGYDFIK